MRKTSWEIFCFLFICGCSGSGLGATCGDGVRNGLETDVDCGGGECGPCADGLACGEGSDCLGGYCDDGLCRRLPDACRNIFSIPNIHTTAWAESVVYEAPSDEDILLHLNDAVAWLEGHIQEVYIRELDLVLPVVAWTDPSLPDPDPGDGLDVLAGYVVTDLLWSSKALRAFDPALAARMERGMQAIGWYGNDLHDVLFHSVLPLHFQPADVLDLMHGTSLALCPVSESQEVNLRVLTYSWDPAIDAFFYTTLAESAVYQALAEHWIGRTEIATQRIRDCFVHNPGDVIFWDPDLRVLVDDVNLGSYSAFVTGSGQTTNCILQPGSTFPQLTYKSAVLLYAVRVMGLEGDETIAPFLPGFEERLWDAQTVAGGMVHCLELEHGGIPQEAPVGGETGEATSAAILAYTAKAAAAPPPYL